MNVIGKRTAWYFLSSLGSAAIAFMVLPFATMLLGPQEYGHYMLFATFGSLVAGLANSGIGYVLPTYLPTADRETARQLIGSALVAVCGCALIGGSVAALTALAYFRVTGQTGMAEMLMVLTAAVLSTPWSVAIEVTMLRGQARSYSVVALVQSAISSSVLLVCLFRFGLGAMSLFVAGLAASVVPLTGAVILLCGEAAWPRHGSWLLEIRRSFVPMAGSNLAEQAQTAFERSWLAFTNGVSMVGLWGHAVQYRQYAMIGLNAVSRAVWPLNLDESRAEPPTFPLTRRYWSVVQIGVIILGVGFALVGREAIGLLTHNRFNDAAPYAAAGLLSLLIQTAGKAQIALLVAHGRGVALSHTQTLSAAVRIGLLAALLPVFGLQGAAAALLTQQLVVRLLVWHAARKVATTPFLDHWVVVGCGLVPGCLVLGESGVWPWPARAALAAAIAVTLAFVGRSGVVAFFSKAHDHPLSSPSAAEAVVNVPVNG